MRLKLISVFFIFNICLGIGYFYFNPARADVFRSFDVLPQSSETLYSSSDHPLAYRYIMLNGSQFKATLSVSNESLSDVTAKIESLLQQEYQIQDSGQYFDAQLISSLTRPYSSFTEDSAVFVQLIRQVTPGHGLDVLSALSSKTPLEPYAQPGFCILVNQAEDGRVFIWKTEFAGSEDMYRFLANGNEDTTGHNIFNIQAYPGSKRIISLAETNRLGQNYYTVYEGSGSSDEHVRYYYQLFMKLGLIKNSDIQFNNSRLLSFSRPDYRVSVLITPSETNDSEMTDIIELSVKG